MLYVTAVHTFMAEHGDELEFEAGDRIEVLEKDDAFGDGWWRGRNIKGEEGLFPATYITESSSPIATASDVAAGAVAAPTQPSPDPSTASGGETTLIPAVNRPPSPRGSPRSSIAPNQVGPTDVPPAAGTNATIGGAGDTGVIATAAAGLGAAAVGVGAVLSKTVNEAAHALEGLSTDENASSSLAQRGAGVSAGVGGIEANENTDIRRTFGSDPRAHFASTHDQIQSFDSGLTASEDEHNRTLNSESEQGHGIDASARARLAAQAKLANEREQARANNRISTGVSGLVYSDESEGEDDEDEMGGRRVSYKTQPQSLSLGSAGAGYGNGLGNGHPSGQPMDSIGSALQPALPLPGTPPLFPGSGTGTAAPAGASQSVPASSTHTPRSGSLHTASASYPAASAGASHNSTAAQWTVDDVVDWAKSKGFDESIWSKFQEHEITGDLLLELDANLLKELDIPAFGKRLRIAQAIGELKRPQGQASPSGSVSGRGMSQPPSSFVMPSHTGGSGTGFGLGPGSGPGSGGYGGAGGYRGSTPPAAVTPPLSGGPDGYSAWAHPPVSASHNAGAGTGTHSSSHSRKTSSISGSIAGSGAGGMTAIKESERANVISSSVPPSPSPHTPGSVGSGPTSGTTAVGTNGGTGSQRNSSTGGATLTKRNSAGSGTGSGSMSMSKSASLGHKRGKSSVDGGNSTKERLSFFGRNRKPAPAAPDNISTSTSGGGAGLGRSGSTAGTAGTGGGFKGFGGNKVHQMQPASPNQRSPSSATMASGGVGGAGALKQIGTPDYSGWMKKKGDRYGWKNRYFVLKGAHLYFLKSEHEDKVKGHIPLAGYRVIVDENTNPGSYGFRLIPSSSGGGSAVNSPSSPNSNAASHAFSSSEQSVIRGWMKALMKATIARDYAVPVTSSCNIPTIPLAEAQALQPRPPSPTTRERTQRATRRENTSSLTPHDASVLTSLSGGPGSNRISLTPSRPERDVRRPSAQFSTRSTSIAPTEGPASPQKQNVPLSSPPNIGLARPLSNQTGISGTSGSGSNIDHTSLLAFVNSTLPAQYPRATSFPGSFVSGEVIFLLVRSVSGIEPSPPVPPSAFAKDADGKPGVDGLFAMMDMLLDAGIDPAGVSLNEVREGNREAIGVLVGSVRAWCEKR